MNSVELRPMTADDADAVLAVQRAAFAVEAIRYGDAELPPLREDRPGLIDDLRTSRGYVALVDGRLVGSVRVRSSGRSLHIARLSVAPQEQGQGIGMALLMQAEASAPAEEALLFTGHLSTGNLRLYARAGYEEVRRERVDDAVVLIYLRKPLGVPTEGADGTGPARQPSEGQTR